jgi:hypothetical protein
MNPAIISDRWLTEPKTLADYPGTEKGVPLPITESAHPATYPIVRAVRFPGN